MKKAIAIVSGVLLVGVAGVLAIAATKPDEYRVERSIVINASPDQIFPHVNDYHNWTAWSPWEKVDPNMKRTYSGPESGKGSKYSWAGNDDVGVGEMEIVESQPSSKLEIKLHFLKPFEASNTALFTMEPEGKNTKVTWAMRGESPFMCKVMQVFMSMDDCCGKDFEKGLASLKTVSETKETASTAPSDISAH